MGKANIEKFHKITEADPTTIVMVGVGRGDDLPVIKQYYPRARVIGVEPLRHHLKELKTKWLWDPNDLFACGLAGRRGKRTLHCNYEPDQRATLYPLMIPLEDEHTETVKTITLHGLRERTKPWGTKTLLWIDAEGAEAEIFDAPKTKAALEGVQWINTELTFFTTRPDAALHYQVDSILRSLGYRLFAMHTFPKNGRNGDGVYLRAGDWADWARKVNKHQIARKTRRLEIRRRLKNTVPHNGQTAN